MGLVVHPKKQDAERWDLSKRIIRLSRKDYFDISNACEGVAVPGSIGSGKTSTTMEMWAQTYFEQGFGGLCMGPKANFAEKMFDLLSKAGALNRAIFLREGEYGINLIGAESEAFGSGNGLEENITDMLFSGAEVVTRNLGSAHDPFWQQSARQMCKHLVVIDQKDQGSVDVRRLLRMVQSLPRGLEHLAEEWDKRECLAALKRVLDKTPAGADHGVQMAAQYLLQTVPTMGEKVLGSVAISLEVVLDAYCRETVYNAICQDSGRWQLSDLREKGLIVVCDYPSKGGYDLTGKIIGASIKRAVQKQIERELKNYPKTRRNEMRPVAFVLDDAGCYANSDDVDFLQTGRESRACALWAFQSLPLMRDQFGGTDVALNKVKTLLGLFLTVVAHHNDDEETNRFYSGKRGQRLEKRVGGGTGESAPVGRNQPNLNENTNYQFVPAPDLPYWAYTTLKRGGEQNAGEAQAIITMPTMFKASKRRWLKVRLYQEPLFHTSPPQTYREWRNRWLARWNHFKSKSVFIWSDVTPRVRIWNGHVPSFKVAGWMLLNRERGKKLLDRWIYFWLFEREVAIYEEANDHAFEA